MSSELIERLRDEYARNGRQGAYAWQARELCGKAAVTIAQLQAELAEVRQTNAEQATIIICYEGERDKARAELAEAREVPGRVVEWLNSQPETLHHDNIATAIEARDWSKP